MTSWYDRPSAAYGTPSDVRACAQVFADVAITMQKARPDVEDFRSNSEEIWQSHAATLVREQMELVPDSLRKFELAHDDVADALNQFAPAMETYQEAIWSLCSDGRTKSDELVSTESRRDSVIDRLRSEESDIEFLVSWAYTYKDHPEVAPLNAQIERLEDELVRLEAQWEQNDDDFDAAVRTAIDLIRDADGVLYNNGWDEFWTQTLSPVLDVVRVVLEVLAVVVMIAAMVCSLGTLAPLIVAAALLVVSAAQIIGTAAAGREITKDMWINLAMDLAAVVTLGAAHYAAGFKIAATGSRAQAQATLAASKGKAIVTTPARMKSVEAAARANKFARGAEMFEGSLGVAEGISTMLDGNNLGAMGIATGLADMAGLGGAAGDLANISHNTIGAADGISDMANQQPAGEPLSPHDWPGLEGMPE